VIGRRVYPTAEGWLDNSEMSAPGSYGRVDIDKIMASSAAAGHPLKPGHPWTHWEVTAPDGHGGRLDPSIHTITEHEDGTITVSPSIDFSKRVAGGFHGYLQRGVWRPV
jgi:hypothetical protein